VYHDYCLNYPKAVCYLEQLRKNEDFCEFEKVRIYFAAVSNKLSPRRDRFCCRDLDLGPMTFKLDRDIDIFKTYLHTENKVAKSSRSKVTTSVSTKIALKVKGQGQMSQTFNHL